MTPFSSHSPIPVTSLIHLKYNLDRVQSCPPNRFTRQFEAVWIPVLTEPKFTIIQEQEKEQEQMEQEEQE